VRAIDIWRATARAEAAGGHPRWRQLAEIALLRLSQGKLQPDEYFSYRLFRRDLALAEKQSFLGYWMWDAIYASNCPHNAALADSKLASYALFAREGVPHATVRAVIGGTSGYPDCRTLTTGAELAAFCSAAAYPLFIKPDTGAHGLGGMIVDGLDGADLRLRDGSRVPLATLAETAIPLVVQDVIDPHPELHRLTGGTPATARVFALNRGGDAAIHCAVLRIPVGRAMVDNFHAGRTGNLIASIDVDRGTCGPAVAGLGFDYRTVDEHPDTGEVIRGRAVPGWAAACELVRRSATLFPGLAIQAWDVAFTGDGPSVIEINAKGEFRILQHAMQRGLIDEPFRRTAGLKPALAARTSRGSVTAAAYSYLEPFVGEVAMIV
jgi:hypothetical protein